MSTISPTIVDTFRADEIEPVSIRGATAADYGALVRLAQRDSKPVPSGSVLVAEADGEIRAAMSLSGDATIADPFHPTADLVALLKARARHARTARSWPGRVVLRTARA